MSKNKMIDAIGGIGDDLIVNAKKPMKAVIIWRGIAVTAACAALLVGTFFLVQPKNEPPAGENIMQNTTKPTAPTTAVPSTTVRPSTTTKPTVSRPTVSTDYPTTPSSSYTKPSIIQTTTVKPTTNEQEFAYPPLVITNEDKYNQLFLAAEDISVLIQHQDFMKTFGNQDELKAFVSKLQQLPIPQTAGAVCTILEYIPDYQMLNIALQTPDGMGCSFTFELNPARANEIREDFAKRNMIHEQEWTVSGCESFKTITEFKKLYSFSDHYGCWVEINGWLANLNCSGLNNNASIEPILAQLTIGHTLEWN